MDLIICAMVTVGLLGLISDELLLWAARPLLRWTKGI
jgi:ABC-type nitrate/sulfonate/bicarbonate transport system permease component